MNLSETSDHSCEADPRWRLENALIALRLLDDPRTKGVLNTVSVSLQQMLTAAHATPNLHAVAPEVATETAQMLAAACPAVADAMAGKMTPERVYFLMGCAGALLTVPNDPFREDRINYVGMFAGDLASLHHSRQLAKRGFPMLRSLRISQAMSEQRDPSARLN